MIKGRSVCETPRLLVVEVHETDAPFLYELMNGPNWRAFIGDRNIHSHERARTCIRENLYTSYDTKGYGLFR
ncbi:GNAT family N-acetyltransferase [Pseudozobellia thermophila]|uniref:hypothetical protein n=1 Tax=Pseudozobellia thermophila TaxID=192903 RepID=UPI001114DB21|nr:hypothetical protein [Pseudozobellia thermophila]